MEHEVFVPVPAEFLRQVLRDPAGVARCVPGLQQDAEESARPVAGRLRIRVGNHTITYRGKGTVTEGADGIFTAAGEGTEVRGAGSAQLTLMIGLTDTPDGTTLVFRGEVSADGRLAELLASTRSPAAAKLLDRFASRLAEEAGAAQQRPEGDQSAAPASADTAADPASDKGTGSPAEGRSGRGDDSGPSAVFGPSAASGGGEDARAGGESEPAGKREPGGEAEEAAGATGEPAGESEHAGEGDGQASEEIGDAVHRMPGSPDPLDGQTTSGEGDFLIPDEPPAEAAHARRTMIGRSAEEVDHAPPRGRYAPVPVPDAARARDTLRWIAPAAALVLASAVVVGRALRRRKVGS